MLEMAVTLSPWSADDLKETIKQPKLYGQDKKLVFVTLIHKTHGLFLQHNILYTR